MVRLSATALSGYGVTITKTRGSGRSLTSEDGTVTTASETTTSSPSSPEPSEACDEVYAYCSSDNESDMHQRSSPFAQFAPAIPAERPGLTKEATMTELGFTAVTSFSTSDVALVSSINALSKKSETKVTYSPPTWLPFDDMDKRDDDERLPAPAIRTRRKPFHSKSFVRLTAGPMTPQQSFATRRKAFLHEERLPSRQRSRSVVLTQKELDKMQQRPSLGRFVVHQQSTKQVAAPRRRNILRQMSSIFQKEQNFSEMGDDCSVVSKDDCLFSGVQRTANHDGRRRRAERRNSTGSTCDHLPPMPGYGCVDVKLVKQVVFM